MFAKKDIDPAILYIDNEIKQYAIVFAKEKQVIDNLTQNTSYIENERTVAFYTNHKISNYLIAQGYQVPLFASEFSIKINNGLNNSLFRTLISEVARSKQNVPWKRCYVDGYFKIVDFVSGNPISHLFLEYKMDNSFVYLDLTNDYLKYKAITYVNETGTIFVYVIFKRQASYPSILSSTAPHYEFIGKNISSTSVSGTKRVYIYLPGNQLVSTVSKKSVSEIETAIKVMSDVTSISNKIDLLKEESFSKIGNDKLIFVTSMKTFNSKVAKSKTLKRHYRFIKALWDRCLEIGFFNDLKSIFSDCDGPITPEMIIREGSFYKYNLGSNFTIEAKKNAIQNGLRTGTNVSLFIVAILDFFNKRFGLGIESPDYGFVPIGRGKSKENIPLDDTVEMFNNRLTNNFIANDEGDRRLKKLAYSLMFFIIHLFEIIYDIDEDNNIYGYNKDFEYYQVLDKLQESLNYAMKKLGYKNNNIDVEEIMEKKQSQSHENLLGFVNWIVNHY